MTRYVTVAICLTTTLNGASAWYARMPSVTGITIPNKAHHIKIEQFLEYRRKPRIKVIKIVREPYIFTQSASIGENNSVPLTLEKADGSMYANAP